MPVPGSAGPADRRTPARASAADPAPAGGSPGAELTTRLGYLLKHAQQRLAAFTSAALAPYGIDGRQLAVLLVLASAGPASQQEAARRLGVDRTTMVGLLDGLEAKGLISRHPAAADRRKNMVGLTRSGQETLRAATEASDEAERRFLGSLPAAEAGHLKEVLRLLTRGD